MKKAVLLINDPDCCGNCPLIVGMYNDQFEEWSDICHITQRKIFDTEGIDSKCPLYRGNEE